MRNNETSNRIKNNYRNFITFLQNHRIPKDKKGLEITHTTMGDDIKGSYHIIDEDEWKFKELYKKVFSDKVYDLSVIERQTDIGPFCFDIDFKFSKTNKNRQYSNNDINNIIRIINNCFNKYFDIDDNDPMLFVLEKEKPSHFKKCMQDGELNEYYKDGFHIFVHCPVTTEERYFLFDKIKKKIIKTNIFSELPLINSIDEIVDPSVISRNGWMMYGSKKPNNDPYVLTQIYYNYLKNVKQENVPYYYRDEELIDLFSVRQYDYMERLNYKKNYDNDNFKKKITEITNKYCNKQHKNKEDVRDEKNEKKEKNIKSEKNNNDITNSIAYKLGVSVQNKINMQLNNTDVSMARKLITILSQHRSENYDEWISVGWALHNISSDLYLDWLEFSKKSDKYDEKACKKLWDNSKDNGLTIASLRWWARQDNAEKYINIIKENFIDILETGNICSHRQIAEILFEMYKDIFKCTSLKNQEWYQFYGNKWNRVEKGYTLSNLISKEFKTIFYKLTADNYNRLTAKDADKNRQKIEDTGKMLSSIIKQLDSTPFKRQIIEECANIFAEKDRDINVLEKFDSNVNLLGFENGVYDLSTNTFRNGVPDDMITLSTGYKYFEFKGDEDVFDDINKFFKQVQPENQMRNYLLTLIASYLDGYNRDQLFIIWTGSGANGKGATTKLISKTFGKYFSTLPATIITQKQAKSSSATPELANKQGVRFIALNEPEKDDNIQLGRMKELTGCDEIQARGLYKEPFTYTPQFKIIVSCNDLPEIPFGGDGGTWRRTRVISWSSKFIKKEEYHKEKEKMNELKSKGKPYEYIFKRNDTLVDNFETWKQAFMWLLLKKYYIKYKKEGLKEPKKVIEHTENYKRDNDMYLEFIHETLIEKEESKEKISEVYKWFQEWFKCSYPSMKILPKKNLLGYFKSHGYEYDSMFIKGIQFIDTNDV